MRSGKLHHYYYPLSIFFDNNFLRVPAHSRFIHFTPAGSFISLQLVHSFHFTAEENRPTCWPQRVLTISGIVCTVGVASSLARAIGADKRRTQTQARRIPDNGRVDLPSETSVESGAIIFFAARAKTRRDAVGSVRSIRIERFAEHRRTLSAYLLGLAANDDDSISLPPCGITSQSEKEREKESARSTSSRLVRRDDDARILQRSRFARVSCQDPARIYLVTPCLHTALISQRFRVT